MADVSGTDIETAVRMIKIFCRGRHGARTGLCPDCSGLLAYVIERLDRCPQNPKPACRDCATHCYTPAMRGRIKEVMRYSGPRMPLLHPLLTLKHFLRKL